jgi:DNA-directed RNA polymerase subunit RPC12/RpoP
MEDYEYQCSWCMNKAILNVDHMLYLVCPICERRTLERVSPESNEELDEAFNKVLGLRGE